MSDSYNYNYNYDDHMNPYEDSGDVDAVPSAPSHSSTAYYQDVDLGNSSYTPPPPPSRNLPPPPTSSSTLDADRYSFPKTRELQRHSQQIEHVEEEVVQKTTTISSTDDDEKKQKKQKRRLLKVKELSGVRAYKICGYFAIGNCPCPCINPNYITYLLYSGHFIIVPLCLLEIIIVTILLFLNIIGRWFLIGAAFDVDVEDTWPFYIAVNVILAHFLICFVPCLMFMFKYFPIFKAATLSNEGFKAPLYIVFTIFCLLSSIFYFVMWTGGISSGLFSGIFFVVAGLVDKAYFAVSSGAYDVLLSVGWIVVSALNAIQMLLMLASCIRWQSDRSGIFNRTKVTREVASTQV